MVSAAGWSQPQDGIRHGGEETRCRPCNGRPCGRPTFHRGDANDDGRADIADGVFVLDWLFTEGRPPTCADAADMNDDERSDVADPNGLPTRWPVDLS